MMRQLVRFVVRLQRQIVFVFRFEQLSLRHRLARRVRIGLRRNASHANEREQQEYWNSNHGNLQLPHSIPSAAFTPTLRIENRSEVMNSAAGFAAGRAIRFLRSAQRHASQVSGPNCPGFVSRETLRVASSNATNGESLPV